MAEEIDHEKCNFRNFRSPVILTLDQVIRHTVVHHSQTSIYTPNFIEIWRTFCGRTHVPTDGHFRPPPMLGLLGRLGVELNTGDHMTQLACVFDALSCCLTSNCSIKVIFLRCLRLLERFPLITNRVSGPGMYSATIPLCTRSYNNWNAWVTFDLVIFGTMVHLDPI